MKDRFNLIVVYLLIQLCTMGAIHSAPHPSSFFGINAHRFYTSQRDFPPLVSAGVQWARADFNWPFIQPSSKDEFEWEWSDQVAAKAQESGLLILGILAYVPSWANGGAGGNVLPEDWTLWENYVYQTVSRYHGQIEAWELWNEPNLFRSFGGDAALYAELVRRSYLAAKRANPNCVIVAGSTAGVTAPAGAGDTMGSAWLRGFYQHGGGQYCDAISIHPYQWVPRLDEGILRNDLNGARGIMNSYADSQKPLWVTEIGWSSNRGQTYSVSTQMQATIIVQLYLAAYTLGVENVFWYDFRNDGASEDEREHNFGLIEHDGTPKPAYYAFSNLTALLGNADGIESLQLGEKVRAFKATFGGRQLVWALWSTEGTQNVSLTVGLWQKLNLISLDGASSEPLAAKNATVNLTVGQEPVYVLAQGKATGVENLALTENPFLAGEGQRSEFSYVLADQSQVTVCIYNLAGKLIRRVTDNALKPAGVNVGHWDGKDDGGNDVLSGPYVLLVKVKSGGQMSAAKKVLMVLAR